MDENQKTDVEQNENVQPNENATNEKEKNEATNTVETPDELEAMKKSINYAQNENDKTIKETLESVETELSDEKLQEAYLAMLESQGMKLEDIPEAEREAKYKAFCDEEKQKAFEKAEEEVSKCLENRINALKKLGEEIEEKQKAAEEKLEEKKNELKGMDPEDPKYKEVEDEIEKLKKVVEGYGDRGVGEGNYSNGLRGKLGAAFNGHETAKENARNKMVELFGEEAVSKSQKLNEAFQLSAKKNPAKEGSGKEEKTHDEKDEKENEVKNEDEKTKTNEEKVQNGTAPAGGKQTQAKGGDEAKKIAEQLAKATGAAGAANIFGEQQEEKLPFNLVLGYNPYYDTDMNSKKAQQLLKVFLGEENSPTGQQIDDNMRIDMLNDPKAAETLTFAMSRMGSKGLFGFFKDRKLKSQMKTMLEKKLPEALANQVKTMDKSAIAGDLAENGITFDENGKVVVRNESQSIEEGLHGLTTKYDTRIAELEQMMQGATPEEWDKHKAELDSIYTKKEQLYNTVTRQYNVGQFAKNSKHYLANKEAFLLPSSKEINTISDTKLEEHREAMAKAEYMKPGSTLVNNIEERTNEQLNKEVNNQDKVVDQNEKVVENNNPEL